MARTNKYTSLNFNDIYEKKTTRPNSSSSSSSSSSTSSFRSPNEKTIISNSRIHGNMLVLSRPTPKPISIPQPIQQQPKLQSPPDQTRPESDSDSISLRPQGRTGSGPTTTTLSSSPVNPVSSPSQSPLPKSNRFVPPHLRPGFVGREEKPVPGQGVRARPEQLQGSPNRYGENGRPKSGGGYERMRRGFSEADSVNFVNRPSSSGARTSSSG